MKVVVADSCGFCHGVRNAISLAGKVLARDPKVYSLGAIIHNPDVVERLAKKGLKTVESVGLIPEGTVLVRSHGASAEELKAIREKRLAIADATCVLVKRVQQLAGKLAAAGYLVAIVGDRDHPEVKAVVGSTRNVVVVADETDLRKLPRDAKLAVLCQTTESPEYFEKMLAAIKAGGFPKPKVINTLCKEAIKRQTAAKRLCRKVDVMFVLGGRSSANTRRLAELCGRYNKKTFHLQNWEEFASNMVLGARVAGVTAGASTPDWVIEQFVKNLRGVGEKGRRTAV
jgi:4-hydroxy-3-methylbut-2-enyl diphosphate reductase